MDNISHRAVIRYLGLKGLTPKEIHEDMVVTLEENAPSYSIEKKWNVEIKRSRDSLEDEPRQRKLVTVTTQDTIAKIHDIIISDIRSITLPLSWVSPRIASMQSSTTNFICPRCQHVVSQNSLDLSGTGTGLG